VVFTIPKEINAVVLGNKKLLYDILFDAASKTIRKIAGDPEHLGAEVDFTAILHTWGQKLDLHPHIHCVVTGGGLSPERDRWIPARQSFFLPVKVLGSLFKKKFCRALKAAKTEGRLDLAGSCPALESPQAWQRFINGLYEASWVVDARCHSRPRLDPPSRPDLTRVVPAEC
jgi:hypothetical protein